MKDTARARVAAIVGAADLKKNISSVYDYSVSGYKSISVSLGQNGSFSGYDYSTSTHFSGSGNGSLDYYDYHTSNFLQLKLIDKKFEGYDYDSQKHFSGSINGNSISFYDYETSKFYNYSV